MTAQEKKQVVEIKTKLTELRDSLQDGYDNMFEEQQEGSKGKTLIDEIDVLTNVIDELDNIT